jgi:thiamine-phosphate pyrophosphorylase
MFPPCTPAAERALQAAQLRARRRGALLVEPADVLAGLLEEEDGHAAALLLRARVPVHIVRQALGSPAAADTPLPAEAPLPLAPATQEALAQARQRSAERVADSAQLLAALLRADAQLRCLLDGLGVDLATLDSLVPDASAVPVPLEEPIDLSEPAERIATARILDAGANRAREALRVIEDYCRFALDDAFLSGALKRLRHDLTEALAVLPPSLLLEARETQHDVGTALSTPGEGRRHVPLDVVQANLKRLQEALRSLEEHGKLHSADLGRRLEQLRYRSYTLERSIVLGTTARQRLAAARLYLLLSAGKCRAALDWTIHESATGGVAVVQLREKGLSDRQLLERARQVRRWTREAGVLFILNDRPDIARLAEADGVHLGQEELSVKDARRIVGPDVLIGVSTHNLEQLRQAILDGAAYVGVGPTFPSATKEFTALAGLDFVRQAAAETTLPAFVIGGVNRATIDAAIAAGARRVAVSQAICGADEPRQAAAELLSRLVDAPPKSAEKPAAMR